MSSDKSHNILLALGVIARPALQYTFLYHSQDLAADLPVVSVPVIFIATTLAQAFNTD